MLRDLSHIRIVFVFSAAFNAGPSGQCHSLNAVPNDSWHKYTTVTQHVIYSRHRRRSVADTCDGGLLNSSCPLFQLLRQHAFHCTLSLSAHITFFDNVFSSFPSNFSILHYYHSNQFALSALFVELARAISAYKIEEGAGSCLKIMGVRYTTQENFSFFILP